MNFEIKELKENNPSLTKLVYDFRQVLIGLNKSYRDYKIDDAVIEAAGYFTPNRTVFGLFKEDDLIGFSVLKEEDSIYWLDWICIVPEFRGYNNASQLFDFSENYAKSKGNEQLYIWIHPDNLAMAKFLKKKGYNILNLIEVKKVKEITDTNISIMGNEYYY